MKRIVDYPVFVLLIICTSCQQQNNGPTKNFIDEINLKRGELISCGSQETQYGSLKFENSASENVQEDFDLAIKLLHSFEYDEAEKAFAKMIDKEPTSAIAYWGVAMSNFHLLWTPPSESELVKGSKAVQIAQSLKTTKRERAYIDAIAVFYHDWQNLDHNTRSLRFEKAMETVYKNYPDDKEAGVFYALALRAAADPNDKSFSKQKRAGDILTTLYPGQPNHPGIAHYLIHTYDYPELAEQGLAAAEKYAAIAPSSAHALHMPSHIFTQLGLWDKCIQSNLASVASAQCYAEAAGIKGHWDEELHGLDYLVYAHLQQGSSDSAKKLVDYINTMKNISPMNFKVAYAFAAIPSRYVMEGKLWNKAANLARAPGNVPWENFPWQEAIIHFTRLMGSVNTNNLSTAKTELKELNKRYNILLAQKDNYKANQVAIQVKTGEAWISLKEGNKNAVALMQAAADMEDKTEKHPVTPGEVIPAREFLGEMLLQLKLSKQSLKAYEEVLSKHPNRFNALYGAAIAAQQSGDENNSKKYFQQLIKISNNASDRVELKEARQKI